MHKNDVTSGLRVRIADKLQVPNDRLAIGINESFLKARNPNGVGTVMDAFPGWNRDVFLVDLEVTGGKKFTVFFAKEFEPAPAV